MLNGRDVCRMLILMLAAANVAGPACAQDPTPVQKPRVRALLVGVSHYDHLENADLQGPANDLPLLTSTLQDRFGLQDADLITLSEAAGKGNPQLRPTLANITLELAALAPNSQSGDQVVVYLAGHGLQQLADENDDLEVDGLDEMFLPADTKRTESGDALENTLTDDELRKSLHAIAAKDAAVWLIADCCHSGTIARGRLGETQRHLPAHALFSEEVADRIVERQANPRATAAPRNGKEDAGLPPSVIALYAARSHEPTIERLFASATRPGKQDSYGLLTYHLVKVLRSQPVGTPLSYRELLRRIQAEYQAIGYEQYPVPLVEGIERDRQVLGEEVQPHLPGWDLVRSGKKWQIKAGRLHGLTPGSTLAVYPEGSSHEASERLGHVRIVSQGALLSEVTPCEFNDGNKDWPAASELPAGARCELVYYDYGDLKLKVAVRSPATAGNNADVAVLQTRLKAIEKQLEAPLTVVNEALEADWCLEADGTNAVLTRAQGVAHQPGAAPRFVSIELNQLSQQLPAQLRQIARVEMLKRIATANPFPSRGSSKLNLAVELLKCRDQADDRGTPIDAVNQRPQLRADEDIVAFRVTNHSRTAKLYVTLLLIDAGYGIEAIYPAEGHVCEAISPGTSFVTDRFSLNSNTTGAESVIALAVKASGRPVDFTSLLQPTLAQARNVSRERGPKEAGSNLDKLLLETLFAGANPTRGLTRTETDQCATSILTWETVAPATK